MSAADYGITPGPWALTHVRVLERQVRIQEHFAIRPQGGPTLAFLPEGRADIQQANARAIAKVPEMIEALEGALGFLVLFHGEPPTEPQLINEHHRIINRFRTILASLRGAA